VANHQLAKLAGVVLGFLDAPHRPAPVIVVERPFQRRIPVVGIVHGKRERQNDSISFAAAHPPILSSTS
jgi:hypothetical protein